MKIAAIVRAVVLTCLCALALASLAQAQTCTTNYFYETIDGVQHGGHYSQCDYGTGQKFVTMSVGGGGYFSLYLQSLSTNTGGVWNNKAGALVYITTGGGGYNLQLDATEAGKLFNGCCWPGSTQGIWTNLVDQSNANLKLSIAQGTVTTKYTVHSNGTGYSNTSAQGFSQYLINAWGFL